jgi:uncharacterized protein YndB with AHSA1/START domain
MDDIRIEETYPFSIEQVWMALTDPAALAEWLQPCDFKAVVGHKVQFHCESESSHTDYDGVIDVVVLEVDKPRKLAYSWKTSDMHTPTVVTYTLTALPGGQTKLQLAHTGFGKDNGKTSHPLFKGGWVEKLKTQLPQAIAARV